MIRSERFARFPCLGGGRAAARFLVGCAVAIGLMGCAGAPTGAVLDGTWVVDVASLGGAPSFSSGGSAVLVIEDGSATLREIVGGGALLCRHLTLDVLGDAVLFGLDGLDVGEDVVVWGYTVASSSAGTVVLGNAFETVTLARVSGEPPVGACLGTTLLQANVLPEPRPSGSSLVALGTTVFYNTGYGDAPIIGFSVTERGIVSSTELTGTGFSSDLPYVMAMRQDGASIFAYATCRCGRSESFSYSDFTSNTVIRDSVETRTLGVGTHQSIRFGFYDAATERVVLGGSRVVDDSLIGEHQLLFLEPETLTLLERRPLLPGIASYSVVDATSHGGRLMVLVRGGNVVELDATGAPLRTYALGRDMAGFSSGIASVGGALAVLTNDIEGVSRLYLVAVE
jgi:hypothetical protein